MPVQISWPHHSWADFEDVICAFQISVSFSESRERNTCLQGHYKNESCAFITTFMPTISGSFLSDPNFSFEFQIYMFYVLRTLQNQMSQTEDIIFAPSNLTDLLFYLKVP
jgi:hypothetical protein